MQTHNQPPASLDAGIDPQLYLKFLSTNALTLFLFAAAGALAAWFASERMPLRYEASTEVVLQWNSPPTHAGLRQDLARFSPWDETFVHTHTRLVRSDKVLALAAQRLRTVANTPLETSITNGYNFLTADTHTALQTNLGDAPAAAIAARINSGLAPGFLRKSRILEIRMQSDSPAFAAAAAQAVSDSYAQAVADMFSGSAQEMFSALQEETEKATARAEAKARELLLARKQAEEKALLSPPIGEMTREQAATAETLKQRLAMDDRDAVDAIAELGRIEHEIKLNAERYGPKHPSMIALLADRSALRAQIAQIEERVYQRWLLNHAKEQSDVRQTILEGELEAERNLREMLLGKMKEVDLSTRAALISVTSLRPPRMPTRHFSPRPSRNLAFGILAGLCAGLLLSLGTEYARSQRISPDNINTCTPSVQLLGQIPHAGRRRNPERMAEAAKAIRTALLSQIERSSSSTILITSPGKSDGKSTAATVLARSFAKLGQKVLLLDLDLRLGKLDQEFGVTTTAGLSEFLQGETTAAPIEAETNLWLFPRGRQTMDSTELVASQLMVQLLDSSSASFDLIIMDTPPVLAVTDAAVLARYAGVRLLVARSGRTHTKAFRQSAATLDSLGCTVDGMILNDVRPRDRNYYERAYYYQYYGHSKPRRNGKG